MLRLVSAVERESEHLYVSENELVQRLLADPSLAGHAADPQTLAEHLRQHKITVDCGDAAST